MPKRQNTGSSLEFGNNSKMKKSKTKIFFLTILGIFILLVLAFFLRHPKGKALLKSKRHFIPHASDSRVLFEPGAEHFADQIAPFLPDAIAQVEKGHFLPFKKPFKVYVFATQRSHNDFLGSTSSYPIRGAAFSRYVYIAPSAFSFQGMDTHKESLMHEMSHLHLMQRLGLFKIRKVPYWFSEGLANIVAGSGGEGVSEAMAIESIKAGKHLAIQEERGFLTTLTKVIVDAGLNGPMYHRQNKMFITYLHDTNPDAFKSLVLAVQNGEPFSASFIQYFKSTPQEMWDRFDTFIRDHYH